MKRAHREIVDTWAMPCLDGCSCKRGANTQWAAERAGGRGGGTKSTRRHVPELQSHRKMFLSMLAEMKCRPMERGESLAQPGTRERCRQGAQLDSNPAPSGSHAQAVTLSVCLLKVLTHSPVLTWQRWGALTWGMGLHQCLARRGLRAVACQSLSNLSLPQVSNCESSGLHATNESESVWPTSTCGQQRRNGCHLLEGLEPVLWRGLTRSSAAQRWACEHRWSQQGTASPPGASCPHAARPTR